MTHYLDTHDDLGDVAPDPVARVETLRSIWLVDDAARTYVRLPKVEDKDPSRDVDSPWDRLADATPLPYRRAFWSRAPDGTIVLRVLPTAGPTDGRGIHTSAVLAVTGTAPHDPLHHAP